MERVFSGAVSLLSILIAVFMFSYVQYAGLKGRPEAQEPYLWLAIGSGVLVVASGISAAVAHFRLGSDGHVGQYWFFEAVLVCATAFPVALWLLR